MTERGDVDVLVAVAHRPGIELDVLLVSQPDDGVGMAAAHQPGSERTVRIVVLSVGDGLEIGANPLRTAALIGLPAGRAHPQRHGERGRDVSARVEGSSVDVVALDAAPEVGPRLMAEVEVDEAEGSPQLLLVPGESRDPVGAESGIDTQGPEGRCRRRQWGPTRVGPDGSRTGCAAGRAERDRGDEEHPAERVTVPPTGALPAHHTALAALAAPFPTRPPHEPTVPAGSNGEGARPRNRAPVRSRQRFGKEPGAFDRLAEHAPMTRVDVDVVKVVWASSGMSSASIRC